MPAFLVLVNNKNNNDKIIKIVPKLPSIVMNFKIGVKKLPKLFNNLFMKLAIS